MAKSVPTLYREWQARQKASDAADKRWRRELARGGDAGAALVDKRASEREQDTAARKLAGAVLDSRGRWRWDGENPPVDLLRGAQK